VSYVQLRGYLSACLEQMFQEMWSVNIYGLKEETS